MENNTIWGGKENILPEAANLFVAMRSLGYEDTAAVADLIDNSIDAKADNIWIAIDDDLKRLFIADDGVGMSMETLNTAVKLGGKKQHNTGDDLGKYGLGLITASLSMGKTIRIITKHEGEYNTAELSFDKIQETNKFIADFHKSIGTEKISFDLRTHNASSGTVLIIDDCDHIQFKTASAFATSLTNTISEVFRGFISEGKHIYVNNVNVQAEDPLYLNHSGTQILVDKDIFIEKPDGKKCKMHVLAAKINDFGALNRKLHINIYRQGFYVLRNNREIAAALEYPDIYIKHNSLNRLRIELRFSSELDDMMGVNIRKHNIAPAQVIINELKAVLDGHIKKMRAESKPTTAGATVPHIPMVPGNEKPAEMPGMPGGENTGNNGSDDRPGSNSTTLTFDFSSRAGKSSEPLFDVSVSQSRISIRYNVKNMFYTQQIIENPEGGAIKRALDAVVEASLKSFVELSYLEKVADFGAQLARNIESKE